MEMLLNGTPKWTHITQDGRKAIIITDKCKEATYPIGVIVEEAIGSDKFWFGLYTPELKYLGDGRESNNDLRPYNPFEGLPVDTPIWVKRDGGHWYRRHFARYEGASVYVWTDGKTSFTQNGEVEYLTYSLTDPEEDDL